MTIHTNSKSSGVGRRAELAKVERAGPGVTCISNHKTLRSHLGSDCITLTHIGYLELAKLAAQPLLLLNFRNVASGFTEITRGVSEIARGASEITRGAKQPLDI